MARIETSVTIKRPIGEVFAVVGDLTKQSSWISGSQSVKRTSDGPIGVGTTWHTSGKMLGRRFEGDAACTGFEADRRFAYAVTTPFPATIVFMLEPVPGGTRVDQTIDAEPGGFFKLAEPLVVTMAKRQVRNDLENLRDLMDANAL